jgi:hypothetical protein
MKTDKSLKITFYALLGLGAILGASLLLKGKDDGKGEGEGEGEGEEGKKDTENEEVISEEQKKVPQKVITATKDKKLAKGMKVYAKIPNIKGRSQNFVNNGFVNNIIWEGEAAGEYLGIVSTTAPDRGSMKDSEGKVYTWFKVALDPKAWNKYNDTRSFLTKQTVMTSGNNWAWFREDTLKA